MAEFVAYVRESSDAPPQAGPDIGHRRMAVVVMAPVAILADIGTRLEAAGTGPPESPADAAELAAADAACLRRLDWLASADIRCHAVVVDRREAAPDTGRLQGRTVEQVVHGAVYEAVAGGRQEVEIRTDAAAVAPLAAGLDRHAAERYEADLFRPVPAVRPADPGAAPMRLAGLLARRLGHLYRDEASRAGDSADPALRELLRAGGLTLEEWPPAPDRDPPDRDAGGDASDAAIRRVAVESAWRFIADAPFPRDEEGRVQRIVLQHLLFTALHGDGGYTGSGELLQLLASRGYENLKEHYLQSAIVAGLRDSGVLVTSSSQGYKIPRTQQDVMDFVNLVDGQVIPLLERLARVRRALDAAGEGAEWTLGDGRHAKLRRVVDALESGAASDDR